MSLDPIDLDIILLADLSTNTYLTTGDLGCDKLQQENAKNGGAQWLQVQH